MARKNVSPIRVTLYVIFRFSADQSSFIVKTTHKCVKAFDWWNNVSHQSFPPFYKARRQPFAGQIETTGKFTMSSTAMDSFTTKGSAYCTPIRWPKYLHCVVMRSINFPQAG